MIIALHPLESFHPCLSQYVVSLFALRLLKNFESDHDLVFIFRGHSATKCHNTPRWSLKYVGSIPKHTNCKWLGLLTYAFQKIHNQYQCCALALGAANIFPKFSIDNTFLNTNKYMHSASSYTRHSYFKICIWYSISGLRGTIWTELFSLKKQNFVDSNRIGIFRRFFNVVYRDYKCTSYSPDRPQRNPSSGIGCLYHPLPLPYFIWFHHYVTTYDMKGHERLGSWSSVTNPKPCWLNEVKVQVG